MSSGTSLGAQVIRPLGVSRATLQNNTRARNIAYAALTVSWLLLCLAIGSVLQSRGFSTTNTYSLVALLAFSPAVLAYGRILGSSWHALKQSLNKSQTEGVAVPQPPTQRTSTIHRPGRSHQLGSDAVRRRQHPRFVGSSCLQSGHVHPFRPRLNLPEYRIQSTYMEEGGLLGFGLIELFSHIPQAGIRVPIVTSLLLFLLLNVAAIGFLFVYEVARILFLDIQDVSGFGGIRLADSRLLRAEPVQQANVLNFCFTGFAGQSMLLLALAMITFWDSSFLPQGPSCGQWETSVCTVMEKDALEQLTWLLASGGQIAFLAV